MSNPNVETVTSTADRIKLGLAIAAFVAGLVGFYALSNSPTIARIGSIIAGVVVALVIAWFSEPGRRLIAFGQDSVQETRKVVWPSRKETIQTTVAVFAFVVVMALFLWVTDKTIEWVLYDLILGWK
ncbi:preprotein translocase subunit SecE [Pigmentiphaga sp. NML080357]|uniref:preprotein translocase subunit SecE n=1 Tax=Pigmentiphaga sp. NML080357 TaxID=2008675 RepID=UPI000B413F19|nr:preprotein translocase subunit SecE [Pigmentiphaga sp. NML080357]OVZ60270.1 preprotein translocase subunit SecE [Pigmentiphaga sp. NML080357]